MLIQRHNTLNVLHVENFRHGSAGLKLLQADALSSKLQTNPTESVYNLKFT